MVAMVLEANCDVNHVNVCKTPDHITITMTMTIIKTCLHTE